MARWRQATERPTDEILASLTPASRDLVRGLERQGQWPALRQRVVEALTDARVEDPREGSANRILRRSEGPAILIVRDGWGWRMDLVLSEGIWPLGGPGEGYPRPW